MRPLPVLLISAALFGVEIPYGQHRLTLDLDRRTRHGPQVGTTVAFAGADARRLCRLAGLTRLRPGPVPGTWLAEATSGAAAVVACQTLAGHAVWAEPELVRRRATRVLPDDPRLATQWHLANDGTRGSGAVSGMDLSVHAAWAAGFTGAGILLAIIDGPFEQSHPDLVAAYRTDLAWDVTTGTARPWATPSDDDHATFCAGLAAARGNNAIGVAGVAYEAGVVPINLLDAVPTDAHEAEALSHQVAILDVSSNSWGPPDDGDITEAPGSLTLAALEQAVTTGRAGKGTVITWAAGNGRANGDNLAWDGYASDHRVLAIGALDVAGQRTDYSESGPSLFAVAPGGSSNGGMVSTTKSDGYSTVAQGLEGTSFATPGAAGVAALVIEANPALTWREVRHVLASTATQIHPTDAGWQTAGGGHPWHPGYGFGLLDAEAAVNAAGTTSLPASASPLRATWAGSLALPDGVAADGAGAVVTWDMSAANDYRMEWVECRMTASHLYQGDLEVTITAPSGRTAVVERRSGDGQPAGTVVFTAVGFLDQDPRGPWTATVRDRGVNDTGRITALDLTIRGYRTSGATTSGQTTIPMGSGSSPAGSGIPPRSGSGGGSSGCGLGSGLGLLAFWGWRRKVRRRTTSP